MLTKGCLYTRRDIRSMLGGNTTDSLPTHMGLVVCGCFDPHTNPLVPEIILIESRPDIRYKAKLLCEVSIAIPIFVQHTSHDWEYVGKYRPLSFTEADQDLRKYENIANRKDLSRIVSMEKMIDDTVYIHQDGLQTCSDAHHPLSEQQEKANCSGLPQPANMEDKKRELWSRHAWDWKLTAPLHSQLTGLIAGFMFSGIVLVLSTMQKTSKNVVYIQPCILTMLGCFVTLIVSSFLYAVTAGDKQDDRRVVCIGLASFVFGFSAIEMVMAIVLLFLLYGMDHSLVVQAICLYYGVSFIVGFNMILTLSDIVWASELIDPFKGPMRGKILIVLIPIAVGIAIRWFCISQTFVLRYMLPSVIILNFTLTILAATYFGYIIWKPRAFQLEGFTYKSKYVAYVILALLMILVQLSIPNMSMGSGIESSIKQNHRTGNIVQSFMTASPRKVNVIPPSRISKPHPPIREDDKEVNVQRR